MGTGGPPQQQLFLPHGFLVSMQAASIWIGECQWPKLLDGPVKHCTAVGATSPLAALIADGCGRNGAAALDCMAHPSAVDSIPQLVLSWACSCPGWLVQQSRHSPGQQGLLAAPACVCTVVLPCILRPHVASCMHFLSACCE